mmetsp:Transcript_23633/g.55096  ORF Transcript_23633/g.55096 Transcript_23633/m.55096 type:complete len:81 (-) Transcript_23633:145-387(-)
MLHASEVNSDLCEFALELCDSAPKDCVLPPRVLVFAPPAIVVNVNVNVTRNIPEAILRAPFPSVVRPLIKIVARLCTRGT